MAIGDWMKSPSFLANAGHFLAGYAVLLTAVLFTRSPDALFWVEVALAAYVLGKEYVVDLLYESGETLWSSTVDALGYLIGNLAAWALVLLSRS